MIWGVPGGSFPRGKHCADPVAAAYRRGAPPPHQGEDQDAGRPDRRVRRRPRVPPHRAAQRVRRRGGLPVPGDRDGPRPGRPGRARQCRRAQCRRAQWGPGQGGDPGQGGAEPDQSSQQGPAQGHVQDGRVHHRVLHRRADLRGDRPWRGGHRHLLRRHCLAAVRRRVRRPGAGGGPPRRGRRGGPGRGGRAGLDCRAPPPAAGDGRRVPVAPRGRAAPVQPGDRVQAAARHAQPPLRDLQGVHRARRRPVGTAQDAARAAARQGDGDGNGAVRIDSHR